MQNWQIVGKQRYISNFYIIPHYTHKKVQTNWNSWTQCILLLNNNLALRCRMYFLELKFTFLKTNNVIVFCTGKSEKFNFCVSYVCQRVEVVVSVVVVSKLILIGKIGQYLWIEGKVCWKSFFRTPVLLSRKVLEWHAMMVLGQFRQGYKLKYKTKYIM